MTRNRYTMRTDRYRYTEWVRWNGTALAPIWGELKAAEAVDSSFKSDDSGRRRSSTAGSRRSACSPSGRRSSSGPRRSLTDAATVAMAALPSEDEAGDDREAASPLATPEALDHASHRKERTHEP